MTGPAPLGLVLPRWQRWAVYSAVAVVAASGVGWLLLAYPDPPATESARSAATWLLRLHGVGAYLLLVAAGSAVPMHLRLGWRVGRNRRSGALLATLLIALAATGLWLYYGPPTGRDGVSLAHWAAGLALPVWLACHRALGLRSRRG